MLEKQIEQDLKVALLGGDRLKAETLRGLKSALLYFKVEKGKRDSGLTQEEEISVLTKESKKRQESADLFRKGGNNEKADSELIEKSIIDAYLPEPLSEEQVKSLVDEAVETLGANDLSAMGQVIAQVKQQAAGTADGALIARLVKERLS